VRFVTRPVASRLLQAKLVVFSAVPFAAYAAEQTIRQRQHDLTSVTYLTWFFLWMFASAGWAMVHLDDIVEWFRPNDQGQLPWDQFKALWKSRLRIVQNYIASLSAGVAFYLLSLSVPQWVGLNFDLPEFVILVGTVPAAMGGTATWDKIRAKFLPG
jgi:hypothetical protein